MSRLTAVLALVFNVLLAANARPDRVHNQTDLCDNEFCECYEDLHPSWTTLSCKLPEDRTLNLFSLDLPPTLTELVIQGGQAVMFATGAFNAVADMRRIQVTDTKIVVFRQFSAVDISVLTLYLDVQHCNILRFEKNAFQNLRGPMAVNITDCAAVNIEGETFSWLLNMEISNVKDLDLGTGSFSLDPTADNVGEHGPGMSIELRNTVIGELTKSSFGSSAARVYFEQVDIHAIRNGAFSANTYNIVMAINCSIHLIEDEAFSEKSLINYLQLDGCQIQQLSSRAFRSAIGDINIIRTRFEYIETGAINTTVAKVKLMNNEFHDFAEGGLELSSWNYLQMENNSFDELPSNAILAPAAPNHKLIFSNNEIDTMYPGSLSFIGKAATSEITYLNNYFGQTCHCNISRWLANAFDIEYIEDFEYHSYCTVNEILARCFNVPDQNMLVKRFLKEVCVESPSIRCEQLKTRAEGEIEIKNPRFPHKYKHDDELSARNKKVIGIVVISCLGFAIVAILFSLYKWWRRGHDGNCNGIKTMCISFNMTCGSMCGRVCLCGANEGVDNARSISQMSVHEYSERHRLNEARAQDIQQETTFQEGVVVPTEEKFTQTLPEQLTKELLDSLKERLDSPENYSEAKTIIENLYEMTKIADLPPVFVPEFDNDENIYEMPYKNETRPASQGSKQMVSIGTKVPSLEKLTSLSPYNRQTALTHDYCEPRDMAVHLYAEITNHDRPMLGVIPDVIAQQGDLRRRYIRELISPDTSSSSSPYESAVSAPMSPSSGSTINSDSYSTARMSNRPLPEKPQNEFRRDDLGEGPSYRFG